MKNKRMWELRQAAENGTLDLYVYGDVESETFVDDSWFGHFEASENSAKYFRQELSKYPDVRQINVYINSRGGDVIEGTCIRNQLKRHPAHKTVYVDGFACSIAATITSAGDEVIMFRNSMMMIHDMYMKAVGNPAELRKTADDLEKINLAGREALLEKSNGKLTESKLDEMMKAETWLTAKECVQYGLADRLLDQDADMSHAAEVLQNVSLRLEQRIRFHQGLAAQLRQLVKPEGGPEIESGWPLRAAAPAEKPVQSAGSPGEPIPASNVEGSGVSAAEKNVRQSGSIKRLLGKK